MKNIIFFLAVGSLPICLWILSSASTSSTKSNPSRSLSSATASESTNANGLSVENARIDLREASSATLKRIDDIDKKIESAKEDLRKNESARQDVIKDLIKIQAKIDAVIKSESNL